MDSSDMSGLYKLIGELSADMKHVLRSLTGARAETDALRLTVRQDHEKLEARLDAVEKFNVRILTAAAILTPILLAVVNWGLPALLALLI